LSIGTSNQNSKRRSSGKASKNRTTEMDSRTASTLIRTADENRRTADKNGEAVMVEDKLGQTAKTRKPELAVTITFSQTQVINYALSVTRFAYKSVCNPVSLTFSKNFHVQ
jgi:hypothetical protein